MSLVSAEELGKILDEVETELKVQLMPPVRGNHEERRPRHEMITHRANDALFPSGAIPTYLLEAKCTSMIESIQALMREYQKQAVQYTLDTVSKDYAIQLPNGGVAYPGDLVLVRGEADAGPEAVTYVLQDPDDYMEEFTYQRDPFWTKFQGLSAQLEEEEAKPAQRKVTIKTPWGPAEGTFDDDPDNANPATYAKDLVWDSDEEVTDPGVGAVEATPSHSTARFPRVIPIPGTVRCYLCARGTKFVLERAEAEIELICGDCLYTHLGYEAQADGHLQKRPEDLLKLYP